MSKINVDFTAINMDGQGSFSSTYHDIGSKDELSKARENFESGCPFGSYELEAYAEHPDGSEPTQEEKAWFDELGINL